MAKQANVAMEAKVGPITKMKAFYQEVINEMAKVTWPSKEDLKASTSVVLMLLFILAGIIFVFDAVFRNLVLILFNLGGS